MSSHVNPTLASAVTQAVHALGQSSTELGGTMAATLRDAAETVAGAAGSAAQSVSTVLPDLAAALPVTLPFVDAPQRRWRPSRGLLLGIGLLGSAAAVAAVMASRKRANLDELDADSPALGDATSRTSADSPTGGQAGPDDEVTSGGHADDDTLTTSTAGER
jgi:hypothetical protein